MTIPSYSKGFSLKVVQGREIQLLGSAPSFDGFLDIKEQEVLCCVNGSALALRRPMVPSITFINTSVSGNTDAGQETYMRLGSINTKHLVIVEGSPNLSAQWLGILDRVAFSTFDFYSLEMRMQFMKQVLGPIQGIQGNDVPSTGFFVLLALLAQGAKSVCLNGFSLVDGHSYLDKKFGRDHKNMDMKVLEFIRKQKLPVRGSIAMSSGLLTLG